MKFYLNENEIGWMKHYYPDLYENMKDVIEPYVDMRREERLTEINERLGELAVEHGYRVEAPEEVPRVSHLGVRADYVVFDEAHDLTKIYTAGEPSFVAQKWLEHRRVCRRTLLECLSGETC